MPDFEKTHAEEWSNVWRFNRKNTPPHRVLLQNRSSALKGLKMSWSAAKSFFRNHHLNETTLLNKQKQRLIILCILFTQSTQSGLGIVIKLNFWATMKNFVGISIIRNLQLKFVVPTERKPAHFYRGHITSWKIYWKTPVKERISI